MFFDDDGLVTVALAIRDVTYLLDFVQQDIRPKKDEPPCAQIGDFVVSQLGQFSERHAEKFIGLAMPQRLADACPSLCSRLWAELDVLPLVLREESRRDGDDKFAFGLPDSKAWKIRSIDEQAESMGRKCVR